MGFLLLWDRLSSLSRACTRSSAFPTPKNCHKWPEVTNILYCKVNQEGFSCDYAWMLMSGVVPKCRLVLLSLLYKRKMGIRALKHFPRLHHELKVEVAVQSASFLATAAPSSRLANPSWGAMLFSCWLAKLHVKPTWLHLCPFDLGSPDLFALTERNLSRYPA